jgi:spermidine/putrescine transport system ATP-binding protein
MLEVREIFKRYEGKPLLRGVSFSVAEGETVCLLGASGSGKSTLLRIIAGLESLETGSVLWDGASLEGVPVHQRNFGLMFQDYALFPHRNVAENVAFGLRMKGVPREKITARVGEVLEQVHMAAFARRRVTDLSGGEQQRVALARALAAQPRLLMLDEPLGALDRALKEQLAGELRSLLHETRIPAIYVTHDQEEAFTIADRLVLLHDGQVEQSGVPEDIYAAPLSPWTARFLGLNNLIPGCILASEPLQARTAIGDFQGTWVVPDGPAAARPVPGMPVTLLFRPRGVRLDLAQANRLHGVVQDSIFQDEGFRIKLRVGAANQPSSAQAGHPEDSFVFSFIVNRLFQPGQAIELSLPEGAVQFLPRGEEYG